MKKDRMDFSHKNNIVDYKANKADRKARNEANNKAITDNLLRKNKRPISNKEIRNKAIAFYRLSVAMFIMGFVFILVELTKYHRPVSILSIFCFILAIVSILISFIWQQKYKK